MGIEIISWLKNNWKWLIIPAIVLAIIIRTRVRNCFWIDKEGNELSLKEFFQRWGKGIEGISPKQQSLTSLWGYPFILGGTLTGIVINILNNTWWLVIILGGS